MKKTYLPFGKFIIIYGSVFLVALALLFVFIFKDGSTHLQIILLSVLSVLVGYYFISPIIIYSVKINGSVISIKKDFGIFKEDRIQKKTDVDLADIKEYKVIMSDRDSEGVAYASKATKKMYIEFVMNDDSKKRIFVSNMSKKQLKGIQSNIKEITSKEPSQE